MRKTKFYSYTEMLAKLKKNVSSKNEVAISVKHNYSLVFYTTKTDGSLSIVLRNRNREACAKNRTRVFCGESINDLTRQFYYCFISSVRYNADINKLNKIYNKQTDITVDSALKDYARANKINSEFTELDHIKHLNIKKLNLFTLTKELKIHINSFGGYKLHYDQKKILVDLFDFCINHDLKNKIKYGIYFNYALYFKLDFFVSTFDISMFSFKKLMNQLDKDIRKKTKLHHCSEHLSEKVLLGIKLNILLGWMPVRRLVRLKMKDIGDDFISVGNRKYTVTKYAKEIIHKINGRKYLFEKEDLSLAKSPSGFLEYLRYFDWSTLKTKSVLYHYLIKCSDVYTASKIQYRCMRRLTKSDISVKETLEKINDLF